VGKLQLNKETIRALDRKELSDAELEQARGGWTWTVVVVTTFFIGLTNTCLCKGATTTCPSGTCPPSYTCGCVYES